MKTCLAVCHLTPFVIAPFLRVFLELLGHEKYTPRTTNCILNEYDYVVVGSGAGGGIMSARLSEKHCMKVLVIDAGSSPPPWAEVPVLNAFFRNTSLDWKYYTASQNHTGAGQNNRQIPFPSGKVVGGTPSWNGMLYVRGSRQDYDKWQADGAIGWGYDYVLPYFKKMENNRNPESVEKEYHGFEGPISVERPKFNSTYKAAVEDAIIELGYSKIDINGRYQKGFYNYQLTTGNGKRCSVAKGYLVPAENRRNLDIVKNALVTKVLIKNGRAVGVEFERCGKTYTVYARREVILSAGAIKSPQLLMLSGIGPKKHLKDMGVPLVADLPVGKNFQEHTGGVALFYSDEVPENELLKPSTIASYQRSKTGFLTSNGAQYVAFLTKEKDTPPEAIPDFGLYLANGDVSTADTFYNIKPEEYERVFVPYMNKTQYWCTVLLMQPKSRGFVELDSKDPHKGPVINPNYFHHPDDKKTMVEGMKACARIYNTTSFRKLGVKPYHTTFKGCEKHLHNQDQLFRCQAEKFAFSGAHQSSSVKMGDPKDPTTVVDPKLRVKHVKGLRVVDASVMPIDPSGNIMAPTMMIGEKAADIIKEEIKC